MAAGLVEGGKVKGRVRRLAGRGRRVLDAAVERGRLEPEELEIALRVASSGI
jgi:hypothetical protein